MLKRLWPYAIGPTSMLVAGLLLAACGAAATPAAQEAATPAQAVAAATQASTSEATQEAATATQETAKTVTEESQANNAAPTAEVAVAGPPKPAECQPVQIPTNASIAPVSDTDWAKGPADAPVTLIEYGDFQ
jgi:hypothetical protein